MKRLSLNLVLSCAVILSMFTACTETDLPGGGDQGPSNTLIVEADFLSDDASIPADSTFRVKISAQKGDTPLNGVEVRDNTGLVALDRLSLDANPKLLTGLDKEGLVWEISIQAQSEVGATETYTVKVTDESGKSASVSVNITTVANVTELSGKLLLNADGPSGQGGINLKTGESTGTVSSDPTSAMAHIKDEGIDLNLPVATNWKQQISTINGSELKYAAAGLVFADVSTKAGIKAAFDDANATAFTNNISEKIVVGDLIVVKNSDDYFLLEVVTVTVTDSDNSDSYEFLIKF